MKSSSSVCRVGLGFAVGVVALGFAALANACGGAESMDVLGEVGPASTTSSGASGTTTSSGTVSSSGTTSGNTSSSGQTSSSGTPTDGCIPCDLPVRQGCTRPDPCTCNDICPDSGGAPTCTWTADGRGNCAEDSYCDAPSCTTGVCVKRGVAEPSDSSPQCGCNGVTYWNGAIAKKAGMAIRAGGVCQVSMAKACGGVTGTACPSGGSCNAQVSKKSECNALNQGFCWQLPTACPSTVGGRARPCGVGTQVCTDACSAIRKQTQWYDDGSCP